MKIGDIIRVPYGSVGTVMYIITAVRQVEDGTISLTLNAWVDGKAGKNTFWLNGIRQTDDGRWIAYGRDEIFIVQQAPAQLVQLRLF